MIFKSRISGASLFEDKDRAGHATFFSLRIKRQLKNVLVLLIGASETHNINDKL